jgi:hypothetical protein
MTKLIVGKYFSLLYMAVTEFVKMPYSKQKTHSIVEFNKGYLIISNEQLKKIQQNDNSN